MKARTIAILVFLAALAGAAVYYYERQINLLAQLTYKIISFNIQGQATDALVTIDFVVRIFSQSTIDALVQGLYIDLYINGAKLGSVTSTQGFVLPALGYSDAPLQISFSPALIASELVGLVLGGLQTQNFAINLMGYVQIKEAFISISVPFNYNTTLQQALAP